MKNIFVLHIDTENHEEMIHYNETVINKVEQNLINPLICEECKHTLKEAFSNFPVVAWRLLNNPKNRAIFKKIKPGDEILIAEEEMIKFFGTIRLKTVCEKLGDKLWRNFGANTQSDYRLVFFISSLLPLSLHCSDFSRLFSCEGDWGKDKFIAIDKKNIKDFYNKYDCLYKAINSMNAKRK